MNNRIAINYYPDELHFIKTNFYSLTNRELLEGINANRQKPITLMSLRHQLYRMNLKRGIQIRWSKADTKFLIKNYRKIGDVELAEELTLRRKSYREINGKRVYRKFTHKHVCKKRGLLELVRTQEQIKAINRRNREQGRVKDFSSTDNLWTRGVKVAAKEGTIRVWKRGKDKFRYIKIDGVFIPYARWYYHNFISPVAKNQNVFHKDMDSINDEPDNLKVRNKSRITLQEIKEAISLLEIREQKITQEIPKLNDRQKSKQKQFELIRIRNLRRKLIREINKT